MSVSLPEFSYLNLLTQKQSNNEKRWSEGNRLLFVQCILYELLLPIRNFPSFIFLPRILAFHKPETSLQVRKKQHW